jgi:hypothetical protein
MSDNHPLRLWAPIVVSCAIAGLAAACAGGPPAPRTDAERLTLGKQIVERMSAKLASAQTFSVKTREVRHVNNAKGQPREDTFDRETVVRRPDRLYTATTGDRQNESWYDGVGLTIVLHKDKVFGQARMPETLDKTLDAMHERYGVSTPLSDFIYSSPAKALIADTTTGGWVGRETIDGQEADHLAFKDKGVNWELWVAATGDPVPRRLVAEFLEDKRLRKVDVTFKEWNFAPQVASDRFTPKVPADYEGIAIVQRARVLKNVPEGDPAAPTAGAVKK